MGLAREALVAIEHRFAGGAELDIKGAVRGLHTAGVDLDQEIVLRFATIDGGIAEIVDAALGRGEQGRQDAFVSGFPFTVMCAVEVETQRAGF